MDKSDVAGFLREQRRKSEESSYRDNDRRSSSSRSRPEPYEEPSNTVMIRGLPGHITEDDIKVSLNDMQANYVAVRLIRDRRTGSNKGVAFIEFIAVNDARQLMQDTRGELSVSGYSGKLSYGYNVKEEVDRYDAEKANSWKYEKPTNTVMLRGVTNMLTENEVRLRVSDVTKHVVDVRLIRDKKTGMSRGFGFVEFDSVTEAQRWMEYQQGYFYVGDVELKLAFTSTRQGGTPMMEFYTADVGDWSCARCGGHNFKRRDFCYKCHLSKVQSKSVMEMIDGKDQIGTTPCNTLILRDLDALTQEDAISRSLRSLFNVTVKQCEIMRDDVTKVSRCFAFVELGSLTEARRIVDYYKSYPERVFELSGKAVTIDYAKNTFSTTMAAYKEALAKRFEDTYEPPQHETSNYDANAAAAVAQAALNQKKLQKSRHSQSSPTPSSSESKASDSSTISFELLVNGQRYTSVPTNPFNLSTVSSTTFTSPDTSKFLFDQSTQYYYDPVTGLYYDPTSQYFFDRLSQKYVFWDQTKTTYSVMEVPLPNNAPADQTEKAAKSKDKKSKAKEAKKIAKEMEKWEKMMNSKKEVVQNSFKKPEPEIKQPSADMAFAMFTDSQSTFSIQFDKTPSKLNELVASYSGDSDDDEVIVTAVNIESLKPSLSPPQQLDKPGGDLLKEEEEKLINWEKLACLLCNRGFKDKLTLEKHRMVSDLHKNNVDKLREKLGISGSGSNHLVHMPLKPSQYRDRAKERREKFGINSPPNKRKYEEEEELEEAPVIQQSPQQPVDSDSCSVASKLMAKMGWQQGQGLGKMNQGRTEIVQTEFHTAGAGIGAAPRFQSNPSDSYRENLKRSLYAKFHDS